MSYIFSNHFFNVFHNYYLVFWIESDFKSCRHFLVHYVLLLLMCFVFVSFLGVISFWLFCIFHLKTKKKRTHVKYIIIIIFLDLFYVFVCLSLFLYFVWSYNFAFRTESIQKGYFPSFYTVCTYVLFYLYQVYLLMCMFSGWHLVPLLLYCIFLK